MNKKLLPLAAMERILKISGAERVADSAKTTLKDVLTDIAEDISTRAIKLASHSGRITV